MPRNEQLQLILLYCCHKTSLPGRNGKATRIFESSARVTNSPDQPWISVTLLSQPGEGKKEHQPA